MTLVIYPPLVIANWTSIAILRRDTSKTQLAKNAHRSKGRYEHEEKVHSLELELWLLILSRIETKSERIPSALSKPAKIVITSELGLVYLFVKTVLKNVDRT